MVWESISITTLASCVKSLNLHSKYFVLVLLNRIPLASGFCLQTSDKSLTSPRVSSSGTTSLANNVRLGLLMKNGQVETKRLGRHQGRVHNLAVEPGSPYIFYSCSEDGFVQHYDLRSNSATKIFCCSSFMENNKRSSSSVRLNSIVIDPRNPNCFAVGGSDAYARVYDIRMYQMEASHNSDRPANTFCPLHLIETHDIYITALA
ncbi:hypothetical protein CQW23_14344 [Capsicum baccatum]|uniref:Uncharacterized protein n=1 Tax=Capsicum baccatum TaxID=33114 RepID=A0A2G2WIW7_CAPBA|nr:hypothetical protein CQW23_14344 [Capsicum baccatum]